MEAVKFETILCSGSGAGLLLPGCFSNQQAVRSVWTDEETKVKKKCDNHICEKKISNLPNTDSVS